MNALQKKLEYREKTELIAIIQQMLRQEPDEQLIDGRGRSNYQVACRQLVKIRSLYAKLNETEQWVHYLTWVRKRQSRLHTLKEEMAAIGLQ